MTDELKPALSAEEWTASQIERGSFYAAADPGLTIGEDDIAGEIQGINIETDALPAMIALANAALPDDSPYKITREDVAELLYLAPAGSVGDRLAAKLAALLPPETP